LLREHTSEFARARTLSPRIYFESIFFLHCQRRWGVVVGWGVGFYLGDLMVRSPISPALSDPQRITKLFPCIRRESLVAMVFRRPPRELYPSRLLSFTFFRPLLLVSRPPRLVVATVSFFFLRRFSFLFLQYNRPLHSLLCYSNQPPSSAMRLAKNRSPSSGDLFASSRHRGLFFLYGFPP